jgi:hypothetical protein
MFPFPVGPLSGVEEEFLTKVTVSVRPMIYGAKSGGIENGTGSSGGTNIQTGTGWSTVGETTVTFDLTANNIKWEDRYNYRIGMANVYRIRSIRLYKNGVLEEDQGSTYIDMAKSTSPRNNAPYQSNRCGINLNPFSRNKTGISTFTANSYPK